MTGRRFLGVMLAVLGVVILSASAAVAAPAAKKGGTVVVEMTTDVDYIDPQLSYYGETWKLEAATACKLLNWPDKEGAPGAVVTPEVAAGLPIISKDGKTYTFTIRPGFKFSNGQAVTAKSFVSAFNRFANPKMQSTGIQFIDIIQGAQAVIDGKASTVSGVTAKGNKLVIRLTRASPDLLARMTMPFLQAIDTKLAGQIDANGINEYASCGPYYFSARTPGRSITLKRNPNYKGQRAANADTIQVNIGNDVAVEYQNVEKGTTDYASGGIPATEWKNVVNKYGLNKKDGRVQVRPLLDVRYVAMNRSRPLFKDNPGLAKAVNWAVDRQAFSAQGGYLYGKRTGQVLPPGMLGYAAAVPLSAEDHGRLGQAGEEARSAEPPRRQGGALGSERRGCSSAGAADPVQPEADRPRCRDQAAPAGAAVHERRQPEDRHLRHDDRALGCGLRGPLRLREHPARRESGHELAAQQLRLLQRGEVQPADELRVSADGHQARYCVCGPRRLDDEGQPAVGAARQLQRPQLHVRARWLPDAEHGPGRRAAPERACASSKCVPREGRPRGRPSQPSICEGGEPCSATSSGDSCGQASSSSE